MKEKANLGDCMTEPRPYLARPKLVDERKQEKIADEKIGEVLVH